MGEHRPRGIQRPPVHQRDVLGGVLADRLSAERLLVAHVAVEGELAEGARDDVLLHRRLPYRPHQQRGHQHVAAEVGGEIGQPCHELLAVRQQLGASHLPLEPPEPVGVRPVRSHGGLEPPEVVVEDLVAGERGERRRVGAHPHAEPHGAPGAGAEGDRPPVEGRLGLAGIALELQGQVVPAVEARLLDPDRPGVAAPAPGHDRLEPAAETGDGPGTQQRQVARALPHGQALHPADQPDQLGLGKRRRAQGERIVPRIAEVPLHPHRAEEEESDQQGRGGLQPVGHRAPGAGAGHDRTRGAPREGGGPARRIPRGEPHALVGGVGPEVHDPAPPAIEVDLEGVPARVPVHPGLVSLVGGGVVDPRLGKGEVGRNRVRPEDNRRREQEYGEAHTGRIVLP